MNRAEAKRYARHFLTDDGMRVMVLYARLSMYEATIAEAMYHARKRDDKMRAHLSNAREFNRLARSTRRMIRHTEHKMLAGLGA